MSCNVRLYAPDEVGIYIGGMYKVEDLQEGTFIQITQEESAYTERVSSDGVVSRTHRGGNLYKLTITLNNTSDSNQIFTYLSLVDGATQMGKFPLYIKDQNGDSLFFAPSAWISEKPNMSFGVQVEAREWVLSCSHPIFNVGGNSRGADAGRDAMNLLAGAAGGVIGQILG